MTRKEKLDALVECAKRLGFTNYREIAAWFVYQSIAEDMPGIVKDLYDDEDEPHTIRREMEIQIDALQDESQDHMNFIEGEAIELANEIDKDELDKGWRL